MARPKKSEPKTQEEIRRNRAARNKRFRERHKERLLILRRKYYQDHKEELKFKDKLRKSGISIKRLKMSKKILSLDFDGVCHRHITPGGGPTTIADGAVPGLFAFLLKVDKDFVVEIYSTRSETGAGRLAMAGWLRRQAIDYANNAAYTKADFNHLMDVIGRVQFPASKPKALVGLDDRILTFEGIWPSLETLLGWKPWNKRTQAKVLLPITMDMESFYELKEVLRPIAYPNVKTDGMDGSSRMGMEAIRRIYDQLRDMEFPHV